MMEKYAQVTKLRNAECVSADGWSGLAVKSLQTEETTKKDLHNIKSHGILNGHSANGPVAQVVRAHP